MEIELEKWLISMDSPPKVYGIVKDANKSKESDEVYTPMHQIVFGVGSKRRKTKCKVTFPEGFVIDGDYPKGNVIITYHDGKRYEGEIYYFMKHGKGTAISANGFTRFEGNWVEDKKHGPGTIYIAGEKTFQGNWVDDEVHGPIKLFSKGEFVIDIEYSHGEISGGLCNCNICKLNNIETNQGL
jgi:hypothetical protein